MKRFNIKPFILGVLLIPLGTWAGLETVTYIDDFNSAWPLSSDPKSEGDNHLRNIKQGIVATFPNITGPMTSTQAELNKLDGATVSTAEINLLAGKTGTIWTSTNDGAGSTLDADLLDAQTGTYYLARANHTGTQLMSTISDAGALATLNAVASAQITDGTVASVDIATDTIAAADIAANAVGNSELASSAVRHTNIDWSNITSGTGTISASLSFQPAAGLYMVAGGTYCAVQVYQGGSWRNGLSGSLSGAFWTDGTNARWYSFSGGTCTYYYIKLD